MYAGDRGRWHGEQQEEQALVIAAVVMSGFGSQAGTRPMPKIADNRRSTGSWGQYAMLHKHPSMPRSSNLYVDGH